MSPEKKARLLEHKRNSIKLAEQIVDACRSFEDAENLARLVTAGYHQAAFEEYLRIELRYHQPPPFPKHLQNRGLRLSLFVDSGVWARTGYKRKSRTDLNEYCDFLVQNEDVIDRYFNLDHIDAGNPDLSARTSFENLEKMRARGLNPIPVFHVDEDLSWLKRMLDIGCDYIGLAATKGDRARDFYRDAWNVIDAHGGLVKVHALGEGRAKVWSNHPWASADSTTWMSGMLFGSPSGEETDTDEGKARNIYESVRMHVAREQYVHHSSKRYSPGVPFNFYFAIGQNLNWAIPMLSVFNHRTVLWAFEHRYKSRFSTIREYIKKPPKFGEKIGRWRTEVFEKEADQAKYDLLMKEQMKSMPV